MYLLLQFDSNRDYLSDYDSSDSSDNSSSCFTTSSSSSSSDSEPESTSSHSNLNTPSTPHTPSPSISPLIADITPGMLPNLPVSPIPTQKLDEILDHLQCTEELESSGSTPGQSPFNQAFIISLTAQTQQGNQSQQSDQLLPAVNPVQSRAEMQPVATTSAAASNVLVERPVSSPGSSPVSSSDESPRKKPRRAATHHPFDHDEEIATSSSSDEREQQEDQRIATNIEEEGSDASIMARSIAVGQLGILAVLASRTRKRVVECSDHRALRNWIGGLEGILKYLARYCERNIKNDYDMITLDSEWEKNIPVQEECCDCLKQAVYTVMKEMLAFKRILVANLEAGTEMNVPGLIKLVEQLNNSWARNLAKRQLTY